MKKMLISCPKCHSIYDIPDNLIPKTGQNFRCQACSNVWNAIPSDALGYEESKEEEPYIEAIDVSEPPHRNYPANRDDYQIVNDTKPGKKTISSKELIDVEGDPNFKAPKVKKKKELTLTSDHGTSFTISMGGKDVEENDNGLEISNDFNEGITASKEDRFVSEKPKKWYVKTKLFIFLMFALALLYFLRGFIVLVYPDAEGYYNKIGLSGLYNVNGLEFSKVDVVEEKVDGKDMLKLKVGVKNNGILGTKLPEIKVEGVEGGFGKGLFLKAKEKTEVEILLPSGKQSNYNIKFVR